MTNEAKQIVQALHEQGCHRCIYKNIPCMQITTGAYCGAMSHEAARLIESLYAELEQVERERDAAVQDLNACCPCEVCTRSCTYDKVNAYDECADFQWRGPGGTKK